MSQSYTCILLEHRGHGQSDHPSGPEANHIDRFVGYVITLLDALEVQKIAFWGYSSAIEVGVKAAEEHPERFGCLVMSGTIGNFSSEELAAAAPERIADHRANKWETLIAAFEAEEGSMPDWMRERIRATDIDPSHRLVASSAPLGLEPQGCARSHKRPGTFHRGREGRPGRHDGGSDRADEARRTGARPPARDISVLIWTATSSSRASVGSSPGTTGPPDNARWNAARNEPLGPPESRSITPDLRVASGRSKV